MAEWLRRQTVNLLGYRRWFESSSTHVNMLLLLDLQRGRWVRPGLCFPVRQAYLRHVTYMCYVYYLAQYGNNPHLWLLCG